MDISINDVYINNTHSSISSSCKTNLTSLFCTGSAVVTPEPCPVGFYCPDGTGSASSNPCPAGTYGPDMYYTSEGNCTACTSGWYCELDGLSQPTGLCKEGYYCTAGASGATPHNDKVWQQYSKSDNPLVDYHCPNQIVVFFEIENALF